MFSRPNSFVHSVSNKNTTKCNSLIYTAGNHTAAPTVLIHKTSNHSAPLPPKNSNTDNNSTIDAA